ncbi:unnamed protein product, partial [Penicillium discolor]
RRNASAARVTAVELRPSSPSIGYQERPGVGHGGVSGAATEATATPAGRYGTRPKRSCSSAPYPCSSTSSGSPARSVCDQRVAASSIVRFSVTPSSCQGSRRCCHRRGRLVERRHGGAHTRSGAGARRRGPRFVPRCEPAGAGCEPRLAERRRAGRGAAPPSDALRRGDPRAHRRLRSGHRDRRAAAVHPARRDHTHDRVGPRALRRDDPRRAVPPRRERPRADGLPAPAAAAAAVHGGRVLPDPGGERVSRRSSARGLPRLRGACDRDVRAAPGRPRGDVVLARGGRLRRRRRRDGGRPRHPHPARARQPRPPPLTWFLAAETPACRPDPGVRPRGARGLDANPGSRD